MKRDDPEEEERKSETGRNREKKIFDEDLEERCSSNTDEDEFLAKIEHLAKIEEALKNKRPVSSKELAEWTEFVGCAWIPPTAAQADNDIKTTAKKAQTDIKIEKPLEKTQTDSDAHMEQNKTQADSEIKTPFEKTQPISKAQKSFDDTIEPPSELPAPYPDEIVVSQVDKIPEKTQTSSKVERTGSKIQRTQAASDMTQVSEKKTKRSVRRVTEKKTRFAKLKSHVDRLRRLPLTLFLRLKNKLTPRVEDRPRPVNVNT
ncbi:hypothetical protein QR680_018872 [Steinernema hermaphroditum]|uniref:Uncharacterized protein n=1 Tax=Steinernema hermaphroditum TaxID=289476 RepID=A0AA39HK84_9BILA|nr:hypothetical protein QR680_018872 [Steinernema hermaphroditum]